MILMSYVLLSVILTLWVGLPLLKPRGLAHKAEDTLAQERVQSLLKALKDLRAQKADATNEDHKNIESRLMLELARIYKRQGILPNDLPKPAKVETESNEAEANHCKSCKKTLPGGVKFCPGCGTPQLLTA